MADQQPSSGTGSLDAADADVESRDVEIGTAPWTLPGTFVRPRVPGRVPALVIVHGSGPQDRDGTIGPNKPYRDLALGLARAGIAVLRYDKRTLVHREAMAGSAITVDDETVDDAVAAVDWLLADPGVDPAAVFVLGHSMGGYLGPRIVERAIRARGLLVLAGNTRPVPQTIVDQLDYLCGLTGTPNPQLEEAAATLRPQVELAMSADLRPDTPADRLPFGAPASYWLDLQGYDPVATAAALGRPILVIQGGRDYQVTDVDLAGWRRGLGEGRGVTYRLHPRMSHLFIAGDGPATPQDYAVEGHVDPSVIGDIAAWVHEVIFGA